MSDSESKHAPNRAIPESLSSLYQEVILDHYRRPRNKGPLEGATHSITMNNPLCGDVIELQLEVSGDRIDRARFEGRGCSISQAAASMMTRELEGRSLDEALELAGKFTQLMHGERGLSEDADLGDLRALAGVARFPVRIKCALLGFNCLEELLGAEGAAGPRDPAGGGA
ncbi:MAG: SUF system NifU family Fe-S cluster assembly protein [Candidatus Palauibacterales bacterium]|nr:SUF system NifU family Fe-S cluster assembly protein [Candidatus Palauibacterales bacterium]MDP2529921.1 SUF system NifU family Fe-S cluster assembly protein [Candidatus Palauibacterales bacterium]MDP2583341.1 SUF system NifU family Fe-S cluster assembly protein [Candidatus Palauibacterales bacterium]